MAGQWKTIMGREFTVELRAVNNRYLDCTVKLPRSLNFAEDGVKQRVKAAVARERWMCSSPAGAAAGDLVQVSLNRPVLEGYLQAMRTMVEDYGVGMTSALPPFPGCRRCSWWKSPGRTRTSFFRPCFRWWTRPWLPLTPCEGRRALPWRRLRSRRPRFLDLVAQVEADSPQTVADYRARLEAKMQEVLERTAVDESRILQEAAIFADKVAVDEETVRLRSHLAQMETMLASGGAVGRKLDFLLQEMNREANTIGSKCTDLRLAQVVVEIKGSWEKIREQIQNIE